MADYKAETGDANHKYWRWRENTDRKKLSSAKKDASMTFDLGLFFLAINHTQGLFCFQITS
ncbi:MAG: hypothetical protein AB8C84_05510 [Oligoflexales bacterium]